MKAGQFISKEQITGLILAGGKGTRMGGVDKGLQLFRGKPMAQRVLQRLQPQVGALLINANQHTDTYAQLGAPVWPDEFPGFAGPLAGLHAGLSHCETPYLVTAPCDSPFLPANLVDKLSAALIASQADIAVAVTGDGPTQQRHPVFCLLAAHLKDDLADYLGKGGRKMDAWFAMQHQVEVHFANETAFANINTLDELHTLGARSASSD
jgi:molybdopterin-guanine dinucleotide biosynthesis protein A